MMLGMQFQKLRVERSFFFFNKKIDVLIEGAYCYKPAVMMIFHETIIYDY